MKICECCGNQYDKCFEVTLGGETFTFDSFECAIQKLAPTCGHCGVRIIGHGVVAKGELFCGAHCSRQEGSKGVVDNADDGETRTV